MIDDNAPSEYTTISLGPTPPECSDRRDGQRYMTVLQASKIVTDRYQELCLVRNISSGGMMAEIFAPLETDETVGIEFKAGTVVTGVVRWAEDGRVGIEFFDQVDVHNVLAPNGTRLAPRSPRLAIDGMAKVEIDDDVNYTMPVLDISQGGIKVAHEGVLEDGMDVIVAIEGLPIRASVVRWSDAKTAGISFNRVMPLDRVAYWAARQRPRHDFASIIGPDTQADMVQ